MTRPTCAFILEDGTRCRMAPLTDDLYCISHSTRPDAIERKSAGSRVGGKLRAKPNRVGAWTSRSIETTEDLRIGLSEAFDQCMLGKVSTSQLSALSQAAAVLARIIEPPKPEDRGDPNSMRDHVLAFLENDHPELKAEFVARMRALDVSGQ